MDYPGNYETPAFPAGKRIAVSRMMSIWTLVAFLIIIFLCGILLWSSRSDKLVPFMIATNNDTGEWTVVGRTSNALEYSVARTMQESLIGNFARDWFKISPDPIENANAWQKCDRDVCTGGDLLMFGARKCAIYCSAGDEPFTRFTYDVLPNYQERANNGEVWRMDEKSMTITPVGKISDLGGTWQMTGDVYSNINGYIKVKAFVKIARNKNLYPQTMGFYVADFNAYRMN